MNKHRHFIIGMLVFSVMGILFYWYEWRPKAIRNECNQIALDKQKSSLTISNKQLFYDYNFKVCLNEKGL